MVDPKTVEASAERAADRGRPDPGLVDAARGADRSLGNPEVVERLVRGFCRRIIEMLSWRRKGQVTPAELVEQMRGECERVGAQFVGMAPEGSAYEPVAGWNDHRGVGMAITVLLGGERVKRAADPGAALFEWLAEQLGAAYLTLGDEASHDTVGRKTQKTVESVINTLLPQP